MRLRIAFAKCEGEEWPNVITATDSYMEEDQGGVPNWYRSTVDKFADDDDCEIQELFVDIPDEAVTALFPERVVQGEVVKP